MPWISFPGFWCSVFHYCISICRMWKLANLPCPEGIYIFRSSVSADPLQSHQIRNICIWYMVVMWRFLHAFRIFWSYLYLCDDLNDIYARRGRGGEYLCYSSSCIAFVVWNLWLYNGPSSSFIDSIDADCNHEFALWFRIPAGLPAHSWYLWSKAFVRQPENLIVLVHPTMNTFILNESYVFCFCCWLVDGLHINRISTHWSFALCE